MTLALPTACILLSATAFLVVERVAPGRALPEVGGWYTRALLTALAQAGIAIATNSLWDHLFSRASMLSLADWHAPVVEGFLGWLACTFLFYWWHRIRHLPGFWEVFHQLHHSPTRVEAFTAFYKHPLEIAANGLIAAVVLYLLLGVSLEGALWAGFFAATSELTYHSNFKSPWWLKYFIQTPELHSIHHALDIHGFNYSDLPVWDRIFGTYMDVDTFSEHCGFPNNNERKLGSMLTFRNVYDDPPDPAPRQG